MATQKFKIAVNNASFPFLFSRAGRSVLQPGLDVAPRASIQFVGGPESFDYNLVKMIYCENVIPVAEGMASIELLQDFLAYSPAVTDFDQLFPLRDSTERNFLFTPGRGKNYVLDNATGIWASFNSFSWDPTKRIVTRAYVDGRTLICYERDRVIEWDPSLEVFNTRVLSLPVGTAITDVRGIVGASNYLVLFTDTRILWSTLVDILEFDNPDNGSGGQIPIDLKGRITACIPISGGFVVYTTRNAVAAFFTNNAASPFSFREIQGSGGVNSYEQVTGDANQGEHYSYGSSGLQILNLQKAESIFPDCTDFLSTREHEFWNSATGLVESSTLLGSLDVKLQLLGNRYLFISYAKIATQFTFALVYDTILRRWGKIRVDHVDVGILPTAVLETLGYRYFELSASYDDYDIPYEDLVQAYGEVQPIRSGFVFLQETGAMISLVADPFAGSGRGVAVLGHIQVTRARMVTLQSAKFDGLYSLPAPTVRILGSEPGDGYTRTQAYALQATTVKERVAEYRGRYTFENFDLSIEGKFTLTSGIVETTVHGSR